MPEQQQGQETLVFTFNDTVVSGHASLTSGSGRVVGTTFSGNTMTVNLTRVADVQKITVKLTGVTQWFPDRARRLREHERSERRCEREQDGRHGRREYDPSPGGYGGNERAISART